MADWEFWRNVLEQEICVPASQNQDPERSWELLERILTEAPNLSFRQNQLMGTASRSVTKNSAKPVMI